MKSAGWGLWAVGLCLAACGGGSSSNDDGAGGDSSKGGDSADGSSTGGDSATGGLSSGGSATGGSSSSGGAATGGNAPAGGSTSSGGSTAAGNWACIEAGGSCICDDNATTNDWPSACTGSYECCFSVPFAGHTRCQCQDPGDSNCQEFADYLSGSVVDTCPPLPD